jgi:hypothetical protein
VGAISFISSGMDVGFALTIFTAQLVSILAAGLTGTFAPLLISFFFTKHAGKLGGLLETTIPDIVGSFAMIVMSYHLLKFIGPGEVTRGDQCDS